MQPGLCLVLAVLLAALYGNTALHQTTTMMVLTNQMVKLSCEMKTKNTIYWLRHRHGPTKDRQFEFLVSWQSTKGAVYGEGMTGEKLTVFPDVAQSVLNLNLTRVKTEDSGTYFCMIIGSPELTFGKGIKLSVVDVIPTTPQPTKKTTIRKKTCRPPSSVAQKGPACSLITLSLLVAGILVLLVSLSVAIHLHCLWRKARIRFMKQFHK